MISLVAAAVLATSCVLPTGVNLAPEQQRTACALLEAPSPSTQDASGSLAAIYERKEFSRARARNTGLLSVWWSRAVAWLFSLFELSGASSYSNATRLLVLTAAGFMAAFGLVWALRRRAVRSRAQKPARLTAPALTLDDPAVHLSRARGQLSSNPREAVREALLSLLSHLERRGLARPDRVKTNRELAAELPSRGAPTTLTSKVTELVDSYDRAFYSLEPVDPAFAAAFVGGIEALQAQSALP